MDPLLSILRNETGIDLQCHRATLEKVKEYYERRYYRDENSAIDSGKLNEIDEIYFFLRGKLHDRFPRSLIDEIAYRKKFNVRHPLPYFECAYKDNQHFKSRKHPIVNQILPDGRVIRNDGETDRAL